MVSIVEGISLESLRRLEAVGRPAAGPGRGAAFTASPSVGAAGGAGGVGLEGLLCLQEEEAEPPGERRARQHGRMLLEALRAAQRAMLAGCVDPRELEHLADLAESVPPTAAEDLRETLAALALRARVELACLGWHR
jgi:hypothetical protein